MFNDIFIETRLGVPSIAGRLLKVIESSLKITSRIFKKLVVYPIQKHVKLNFYQKICVNFFQGPPLRG